jgi:hypothetical protein
MANTKIIDASGINLTDLTPTQMKEFTKLRDGHEGVLELFRTLLVEKPEMFKRAGIDVDTVKHALLVIENRQKAEVLLPVAENLVEMLRETIVSDGKEVADVITEATNQAERRAEKDPKGEEILAAFETMITYQNAPAAKAQATQNQKKAQAKPEETR